MKRRLRIAFLFIGIASIYLHTYVMAQRKDRSVDRSRSAISLSARGGSAYFPLKVGNEWIYSNGSDRFKVQILRETEETNGMKYFEVSGYFAGSVHKLRYGSSGEILEYNPNGQDFLWYQFDPFKNSWRMETENKIPCTTGALVTLSDAGETVAVPAGSFDNTLQLAYQAICADSGILTENFAGGVGLIRRVVETFAGPLTYKLVYAHVDTAEYPAAYYGVQVSADRPVYYNNLMPPVSNPWPTAQVLLTVRNTTEIPIQFTFPTSQRFDFVVRDALGAEVLRWSDKRAFSQVVGHETLVGESWRFATEIKLQSRDGKALPAGFYTLTGSLTSQGSGSGPSGLSGTVSIEIRDVQ
jgi:hypothetical protein